MRAAAFLFSLFIPLYFSHSAHADDGSQSFKRFIDNVLENSSAIKVKVLELEAEGYKAKQTDYFYLPKLSANGKVKNAGETTQAGLSATSLVYDDTLTHRFNEKDLKLMVSELALTKEKEDLYTSITNNIIGIHYFNELSDTTSRLSNNAKDIFSLISRRYNGGVAKLSDVEQATLLMQRIQTEQQSIGKEIEQYKSNIEVASGIIYPSEGVSIPSTLIKNLITTVIDNKSAYQNTEYTMLRMQADAIKENAYQQDSLFNFNLVAEEKYGEDRRKRDESYVGVELKVNIFDADKKFSEKAQLKLYEAAKGKADYKYKEIVARIKNLKLISSSNESELTSLHNQRNTMQAIIRSQEREYDISQSSFYEMVNTLFDMLTVERRIAELTIVDMQNKMEYVQLTGKLAEIEKLSS